MSARKREQRVRLRLLLSRAREDAVEAAVHELLLNLKLAGGSNIAIRLALSVFVAKVREAMDLS